MTTEQVTDYYEVDYDIVKKVSQRNADELESDGTRIEKMENFIKGYNNGNTFSVTNRGLKVYPRRAILRVGMLLRDSVFAREVIMHSKIGILEHHMYTGSKNQNGVMS